MGCSYHPTPSASQELMSHLPASTDLCAKKSSGVAKTSGAAPAAPWQADHAMRTATLWEPKRRPPVEQPVKSLATLIAEHPFLAGMKPAHLDVLCECAMQTKFPKDQSIFREGDLANRVYLIEEGRVALESRAGGDQAVLIQTLGKGDVLGWSLLFPPYYW